MQQSIGAGDIDERAIHGDVGGDGSCVVDKADFGGDGVGVEVVDQDALISGHDVGQGGIGREEEVDGMEGALADVDVDGVSLWRWGGGEDDGLRTEGGGWYRIQG